MVYGADPPLLPGWFWDPPPVACAVGYAPPYADLSKAYQEAFEDAAWRMFRDRGCRIAGERGLMTTGNDAILMGGTVDFVVDSSGFEAFKMELVRIDSLAVPGLALVLITLAPVDVDRNLVPSPDNAAGSRSDPGFSATSGEAEAYFFEISSWQEAERAARMQAAFEISTQRRDVAILIDDRRIETTAEGTNAWLQSLRTVSRRIDPQTGCRQVRIQYQGFPLLEK